MSVLGLIAGSAGAQRTVAERRRLGEGDGGSVPSSFCGVPPSNGGDDERFGEGELESVSRSAISPPPLCGCPTSDGDGCCC